MAFETEQVINNLKNELLATKNATKETLNVYASIAKNFMEFIDQNGSFTRQDAISYLAKLRKEGKSDNYRRLTFYTLKRLYGSLESPWNIPVPKLEFQNFNTPLLSPVQIEKLVKVSRDWGDPQINAFLVVSTIYGLRRAEMASIEHGDIDTQNILIRTKKGGIQRKHLLPDEIKKYIHAYNWNKHIALSTISTLFHKISKAANLKIGYGTGWHSIRRSLVTELDRISVRESIIDSFLRWKISGTGTMRKRYIHLDDLEVDKSVFKVHPFLPFWR